MTPDIDPAAVTHAQDAEASKQPPNRCEKCGRLYWEANPAWLEPRCLDARCGGRIRAMDGGEPKRRA